MGDAPIEPQPLPNATASSRRGKPFTLREWLPVWIVCIALIALIWPRIISSPRGCRELSTKTQCSTKLTNIGQALVSYLYNKGSLPAEHIDWGKALIDSGAAVPPMFLCPCAPEGRTSYYYAPGRSVALNSNEIVVYEDPRNHGGEGGNVLFADCHVEFIKAPKYQALINSLKLPGGRPWAPHLAAKK